MKWDDHRSWVLGSIAAAIIGLGVAVFSVVYGAYYNRTHHIAEWGALGNILKAPVPLWFVFPLGVLAAICLWKGYFYWRRNSYLEANAKEEGHWQTVASVLRMHRDRLEEKLAEIERKEPKLHGVWNQAQAFWHMGRHGEEPMTQIGGWIDLTSSNTKDNLFLLAAYVDGRRSDTFIDVPVKPNIVNREVVMLFFHPPLGTFEGKPFEATIVVEDQFNRKYELSRQSFRATPGPTPPAINPPTPSTPKPVLHFPWRVSGWCRIFHEGEEALRISGDGPLHLDGITEKVLFTGVRIEGAEVVGVFDNFEVYPDQTEFRGINIDFRGIPVEDKENLTVKLTFVDLRGNEYPLKGTTFRPIAEPERVGGMPWF